MKLIIIIILIVFLGGCVAQSKKICNEFGFKAGSPEFANCVMNETHRSQDAWNAYADSMKPSEREKDRQLARDLHNSSRMPSYSIRSPLNGLTCRTTNSGFGNSTTRCY